MIRIVTLLVCLLTLPAFAQSALDPGQAMNTANPMMHMRHMMTSQPTAGANPAQSGQSAFAAILEIDALLEADPKTDWSKVNIEALHQHLIDMDNVTLHADVKNELIDGGKTFVVSGAGQVRDSIRHMIFAHALIMNGAGGWTFVAAKTDNGAELTVKVPAKDLIKLQALGFIGAMTCGLHHQTPGSNS